MQKWCKLGTCQTKKITIGESIEKLSCTPCPTLPATCQTNITFRYCQTEVHGEQCSEFCGSLVAEVRSREKRGFDWRSYTSTISTFLVRAPPWQLFKFKKPTHTLENSSRRYTNACNRSPYATHTNNATRSMYSAFSPHVIEGKNAYNAKSPLHHFPKWRLHIEGSVLAGYIRTF